MWEDQTIGVGQIMMTFPVLRNLRRKLQHLVLIGGDDGLVPHAGFQKLVKQICG